MQREAEELRLLRAELGQRPGAQPLDLPALARRDRHLERRAAIPVEQQPAERLEARVLAEAEAEQQVEGRRLVGVGAMGGGGQRLLQVGQRLLVELAFAQLEHRLDIRDDAVAARLGQQRGVIAVRLVVVGARQIDDLGAPAGREQLRPREIVAGGDDLVRRLGVGEIARMVDENDPAVHDVPEEAASRRDAGSRMRSDHAAGRLPSRAIGDARRDGATRIARRADVDTMRRRTARRKSTWRATLNRLRRPRRRHAAVASAAGASRFSKRNAVAPSS